MDVNLEYYTKSHSVSVKKKINGSIEDVWRLISKPSNLELFHPFCKSNKTVSWSNGSYEDSIEYYGGRILGRKFYNWIEGIGYDLKIGDSSGNDSIVSWRIHEAQDCCTVSITIMPYIFNRGSKIWNFFPFFAYTKPKLSNYLDSVLMGLKFFSEKKEVVTANQFGTHSWFS